MIKHQYLDGTDYEGQQYQDLMNGKSESFYWIEEYYIKYTIQHGKYHNYQHEFQFQIKYFSKLQFQGSKKY
ncbi:unnamed protein product [Paramecium sonneborni]|uniref:Uncharacterized protein n=1 Tax=Paramecium sonneborni TaxID=65129 RepID=A0A8S1LUC9_9CILI|nr:unnamed protein product [Paramecium sonneborni]